MMSQEDIYRKSKDEDLDGLNEWREEVLSFTPIASKGIVDALFAVAQEIMLFRHELKRHK